MGSLLADLQENNICQSLRYYGPEDIATGWEIKEIVDNVCFFNSVFDNYATANIETIDDYVVYLFSLKFCALEEMVPYLTQEEHKVTILKLSTQANAFLKTVGKGEVIKFINANIEEIFAISDQTYGIRDVTIELIKKYTSGMKPNVYSFLCTNFCGMITQNFDAFANTIKATPFLFEVLYPSGHLHEIQERGFKRSLDIFVSILEGKHEKLKMLVNERVVVLCNDVETLLSAITMDNVMMCEGVVREFTAFMQHIRHPKANKFVVHIKRVEELLYRKIEESGQCEEYIIPVEEIIKYYSDTSNWILRLLSLTHSHVLDVDPPKIVSRLDFAKENTHHFADYCSTNVPTDSYFTYSHQAALMVRANIGAGTILGIMSRDNVYQDYATIVQKAMVFISGQMQREDQHLVDDWILLDKMIQIITQNGRLNAEALQPLCYSAAMFTCSLIEKVLRLFYTDKVKDVVYVPIEHATLGQLLTDKNHEIVETFGTAHTKHLAFFLSQLGEKKIGRNYRNRLAHWSEISDSMLTVSLVAELLWLFTDVINTIFVYYMERCQNNKVVE